MWTIRAAQQWDHNGDFKPNFEVATARRVNIAYDIPTWDETATASGWLSRHSGRAPAFVRPASYWD
jgi:hypothetical protein